MPQALLSSGNEELLLRVSNLLKRSSEESVNELEYYEFGDNKINFITYEADVKKAIDCFKG